MPELSPYRARAFSLPYPISTNRYWRSFRGRVVVSAEAKTYKAHAALQARAAGIREPVAGLVRVSIDLAPRRPQRYKPGASVRCIDLDNALKVALDAMNGVAWLDDSQVVAISARLVDPVPDGKMQIIIEEAA